MSLKRILSYAALLSCALLAIANMVLHKVRDVDWEEGSLAGLGQNEWISIHNHLAIFFLTACVALFLLNIRTLITFLDGGKDRTAGKHLDLIAALVLTTWVLVGTIAGWPPFSRGNASEGEYETAAAEEVVEEDPQGMPEKMPWFHGGRDLERICGEYELDLVSTVRELRELGIDAQADWSLKKTAAENGMETKEVYDVIRQLQ